jgi:peptidoglycan/xylan/chitin deacetylase (PgdA/CDA1 family)
MSLVPPPSKPLIHILMYHQVGDFESPKAHRACYCRLDRFRAQMAFLKFAGYRVIGIGEALDALYGDKPVAGRSVVLSFDDGYLNFYQNAFPVLQQYGYPAVLFAVSGLVGGRASWLDGEPAQTPMMDGAMLRAIRSAKVEIGAHSVSHPRLSRLPQDQAVGEIRDSKRSLEALVEAPVDVFAYPYGDYNERIRDAVAEAGYRAALTCSRGPANTAPNPFEIPRKGISFGDSLAGVGWKLAFKNKRKDRYA